MEIRADLIRIFAGTLGKVQPFQLELLNYLAADLASRAEMNTAGEGTTKSEANSRKP